MLGKKTTFDKPTVQSAGVKSYFALSMASSMLSAVTLNSVTQNCDVFEEKDVHSLLSLALSRPNSDLRDFLTDFDPTSFEL